jgi:hypothetical protein
VISFANTSSSATQVNRVESNKHDKNCVMYRKARLTTATIREKLRQAKDKRPPITKKALSKLWYKNVRIEDIALYFGVSDERIRVAAARYNLDPKNKVQEVFDSEWQPGDPTQEEIKERAAEIRAKWTATEHLIRRGIRTDTPVWTPPAFTYNTGRAMFVGA